MQAAKSTNHYDNKNLIQLCNNNKKCLSERSKPQTHFVNLEAIPELVPYISKEKINLHSHFYVTTNASVVSMKKKKKLKSFTVEATRFQQLLLIRDISTNISASKTLGRSVLSCVCQEQEQSWLSEHALAPYKKGNA